VRIQLAPLKDRLLGSITPNEVDQPRRSIVGRSVANDAMKCLRMLFRWVAARDDDLGRNPVRLMSALGVIQRHPEVSGDVCFLHPMAAGGRSAFMSTALTGRPQASLSRAPHKLGGRV
jgi:hypothetical protein